MNASAAQFNLVTAQSPSVDRRALSQAWYSALHIAGREPRTRPASERHLALCHPERSECNERGRGTTSTLPVRRRPSTTATLRFAYARDDKRIAYARDEIVERRARTLPLAKAIVEKIKSNTAAARFLIESPRGRVIIHIVRRDGRVHLAAVCGAAVRGEVEKALAQARFALAGMGVSVR